MFMTFARLLSSLTVFAMMNSISSGCQRETSYREASGLQAETAPRSEDAAKGLGIHDVSILIPPKELEKSWRWPIGSYGTFDTPIFINDVRR